MGTLCLLCVAKEVFDLTLQHQQQQQQQHATVAQLLRGKREKEDEEEPLEDEAEFVLLVDLQAMIKRASGLYGLQSVLAYFFSMNLK